MRLAELAADIESTVSSLELEQRRGFQPLRREVRAHLADLDAGGEIDSLVNDILASAP
ncbi:MAG: hypothetical protein WKF64_07905 [Ilumatobacteraceae bacterium]